MAETRKNLKEKQDALYDNYEKCRTRKCSKYIKKVKRKMNLYMKEDDKTCRQKTVKARGKCGNKIIKSLGISKLVDDEYKCTKKKCRAQQLKAVRFFNKMGFIWD